MSLRIACDLDGTIADMEPALLREAQRLFGFDVELRSCGALSEPVPNTESLPEPQLVRDNAAKLGAATPASGKRPLTDRQRGELWAHVRGIENFWTKLDEVEPGAVARLGALAALHGWEVMFLTQRPRTAGETTQLQSQRWLAAHGFELPSVYVVNGSRGRVVSALALDAVIDDRLENCLDIVTHSQARSILVWRDSPGTVPQGAARCGIDVAFSANEAFERLAAIAVRPRDARTLVTRVRDAIGI